SGNKSNKANTYHCPLHNNVKHILIKPLFVCNSPPHNHNEFWRIPIQSFDWNQRLYFCQSIG
ncbi:Bgt-51551, partial [Blumeria graminis f. sp. tritici]